jgi:biopolymer transport protein ExbD
MPFIDIIFQLLIFFLLTMKFRQHEGYLLSMLPDHGLSAVPNPEMPNEVRVLVCADPSHRMDQHLGYKQDPGRAAVRSAAGAVPDRRLCG